MGDEIKEYATFTVTSRDGNEVEMAVVDEFEFEHKNYVVGAVIKDDVIDEEGLYIYKVKLTEDDFVVEKIHNQADYERIAKAYMELDG